MLVINYDDAPNKSIFYLSAMLYEYIINTSNDYQTVKKCFNASILKNDLLFYYSMDWLFLIGKIKSIDEGKIICV